MKMPVVLKNKNKKQFQQNKKQTKQSTKTNKEINKNKTNKQTKTIIELPSTRLKSKVFIYAYGSIQLTLFINTSHPSRSTLQT